MTIAKEPTIAASASLLTLRYNEQALVRAVQATSLHDPIARRLRELGFVPGEPVRVVAKGPVGADPLLIQIGFTRFALRRAEAARVLVETAL
jgi:ferrous iron transport protein A